jgi:hypothetical protein
MDVPSGIGRIAERLKHGQKVYRITVRNFLGHFGAERRGAVKVEEIEKILDALGLETEPNFRNAWIDEPLRLRLKVNFSPAEGMPPSTDTSNDLGDDECDDAALEDGALAVGAEAAPTSAEPNVLELTDEGAPPDPIFRIGSLPAANKIPVVVGQDDTLIKAITIMLQYDFSQLPVMRGDREVKGVITWKSICSRLVLSSMGSQPTPEYRVRDYREDVKIVDANQTLFDVIPVIVDAGYVLIRHGDRKIKGPVTITDLSLHLQALTEPFLSIRQIELQVRNLIGTKVNSDDLSKLSDAPITAPKPRGIADLTFGEYVRLIQNPVTWGRLNLLIDKRELAALLDEVRDIRNEVMHFDPDPMTDAQRDALKRALRFMKHLYELVPGNSKV